MDSDNTENNITTYTPKQYALSSTMDEAEESLHQLYQKPISPLVRRLTRNAIMGAVTGLGIETVLSLAGCSVDFTAATTLEWAETYAPYAIMAAIFTFVFATGMDAYAFLNSTLNSEENIDTSEK